MTQNLNLFQRMAARVLKAAIGQQRRLNSARYSRLVADWQTQLITLDSSASYGDLRKTIERTRDLMQSDSLVERACLLAANGVVGPDGIKVQNKYRSDAGFDRVTNRSVETAAEDFFLRPDVTGRHTMIDVLRLTVRHLVIDGNFFWTLKRDRKFRHGLAIQIWDITRLALEKNEVLPDGSEIRMGVEMDSDKRPVAYWRYKTNPYDTRSAAWGAGPKSAEAERIPAEDVIHFAHIIEAEQTLGIPMLTQGVLKLRMHGMYEEAAIVQARMAAQCGAVIETTVPAEDNPYAEAAAPVIKFETGMIAELPPGKSMKPMQFSGGIERYENVGNRLLRTIAGGLGISFASLANDPTGLNLAVIKQVFAEEREHYKTLQTYIINTGLRRLMPAWAAMSVLAKQLRVPAADVDEKLVLAYLPRRWSSLDPQGDVNAYVTAINNALMDPETAIRLLGYDPDLECVVEGIKARNEMIKTAGVTIFTVSGQATGGQNNPPGTSGNPNVEDKSSA
jgi:lambda family phage portal protein